MNSILMRRFLNIVVFSVFTMTAWGSANEPTTVPDNDVHWNVRWQFRPDSKLIFDAAHHQSPYFERLHNSAVQGESETTLCAELWFRYSPRSIVFDLKTDGTVLTPTKSSTQVAHIFNDSTLTCKSIMRYDFNNLCLHRIGSWISGNLQNSNIRINLNNPFFARIKLHLIMQGFNETANILKKRGLTKLQNQMHEEIAQNFDAWTQWLKNGFTETPNSPLPLSGFQCRSDKRGMYGTFCLGTSDVDVVPFPKSAGTLFAEYPVALAVEQSALNKMMQIRLGGKTIPLHRLHEFMFSDSPLASSAQETSKTSMEDVSENSDEEKICYATLNTETPVEFIFTKEGVTLLIHADQFEHAQKTFPGMDIVINYQQQNSSIEFQDAACLVLDDDIRITPKQEENGESQRNLRAITIRRWLLNFFKRDLPKQISCDSMSIFEDDMEIPCLAQFRFASGKIRFEENWFFITYRLESKE